MWTSRGLERILDCGLVFERLQKPSKDGVDNYESKQHKPLLDEEYSKHQLKGSRLYCTGCRIHDELMEAV
jgi:hypothetical protein